MGPSEISMNIVLKAMELNMISFNRTGAIDKTEDVNKFNAEQINNFYTRVFQTVSYDSKMQQVLINELIDSKK